uniref:Uncharacterized protein n=1 Tax=viral metagenome TaxID=1070528 RepID=A0A6C0F5G7_9ZZZZ|tara:strand:+ start:4549 stop:5553 length:1005 start_codon:yes stop_codon:yes gene_type:complete
MASSSNSNSSGAYKKYLSSANETNNNEKKNFTKYKCLEGRKNEAHELKQGLENHYHLPLQEEAKVAQYVELIHEEMLPMHNMEAKRPYQWINPVVGVYKEIRKERVKNFRRKKGESNTPPQAQLSAKEHAKKKKEYQSAMKGLKMHIIVGCILRCVLIQNNSAVPIRILLHFLNSALKRWSSTTKNEKTPITLRVFDQYRTNSSKGIMTIINKQMPKCYLKEKPENLVSFTGYRILGLCRKDVLRAQRLARNIVPDFEDITSSGDIAIGALFCVLVSLNLHNEPIVNILGLSKAKLKTLYTVFKDSTNSAVQKDMQTNVCPNSLFTKKKPSSRK